MKKLLIATAALMLGGAAVAQDTSTTSTTGTAGSTTTQTDTTTTTTDTMGQSGTQPSTGTMSQPSDTTSQQSGTMSQQQTGTMGQTGTMQTQGSMPAGSMPNMILRHGVMCAAIGGGVWLAAPYGTNGVAAVVSTTLYLALLLPARHDERAMTGGRLPLLGAMLPGLGLGAALLALGEFVLMPLAAGNWLVALALVLSVNLLLASFIAAVLPSSWLPSAIRSRRRALFAHRKRQVVST